MNSSFSTWLKSFSLHLKRRAIGIFLVFVVLGISTNASAQGVNSLPVRQSFATIMFAGLGGAILGLSTLSFYGDPQEHIGNIWLGLGLGTLAGTTYVFSQANQNNRYAALDPAFDRLPERGFRKSPLFLAQFEF